MLRLMDFLFRCFYNLASKRQPSYGRIASAHSGLWLFLCFCIIGLYSLMIKILGNEYLPHISGFVYIILCGMAAGGSALYFTRHPSGYWDSYQGNTGGKRASYALLGVLSYCLLALLCSHL